MAQNASNDAWWIVTLLPGLLMALSVWAILRKRRWSDLNVLGKAASMPPEHIQRDPKSLKDLIPGEEAYVSRYRIVTSKKGRTFVAWDARVEDAPESPASHFAPLRVRRMKRGFSLTVRPGDEFSISPLPWGCYAPVIEIVQAAPIAAAVAK